MGKWSNLPVELVELIEDSLILYADKIRIRAVCLYWHLQLPKISCNEFPSLLHEVSGNADVSHALFNPIDKKSYHLDLRDALQGKICKGSSHGWVVTVEDTKFERKLKKYSETIYLVNPLTRSRIRLPPRNRFPDIMKYNPYKVDKEYSVFSTEGDWSSFFPCSSQSMNDHLTRKFVMSSDPSRRDANNCVIATIYGPYRRVACCTLENMKWNPLPIVKKNGVKKGTCIDIMFHKDKLHAIVASVGGVFQVLVFENINRFKPQPHIKLIARHACDLKDIVPRHPNSNSYTIIEGYLAEHSDGSCLMMVERYVRVTKTDDEDVEISQTLYFRVYRVDPINHCMVELKSIGEDAIVLGMNAPISISSRNSIGYKGNHIYFTDSSSNYDRQHSNLADSEIGVFNLEDGTLQPLCGLKSTSKFRWPPPIWFSSSPCQYG